MYVDARHTREEALNRAGELAQLHKTLYSVDDAVRRELNTKRKWFWI